MPQAPPHRCGSSPQCTLYFVLYTLYFVLRTVYFVLHALAHAAGALPHRCDSSVQFAPGTASTQPKRSARLPYRTLPSLPCTTVRDIAYLTKPYTTFPTTHYHTLPSLPYKTVHDHLYLTLLSTTLLTLHYHTLPSLPSLQSSPPYTCTLLTQTRSTCTHTGVHLLELLPSVFGSLRA